ncbi:MAG TPA: M20/M25/M40 family metallo-hydrolase, partial [Dehalococcoidia bacterium]|nr:M20/M25/M40 family metallo-hydrolase [Dehalococcoidia bacterium]
MRDIFKYIDDHLNDSIASLVELCKLPTVSAQKQAISETAEHVVGMLRPLGFETQVLPKEGGGPSAQPVVFASLTPGPSPDARERGESGARERGALKTLLFYDHYDVQPPEPLELWTSPPFQPTLRDGKLYGRGVSDNKGNIAARVAAIKAWREVRGELPCSLKFCIEGDEEIGSPHMEEFVEEHRELLSADACLWEGGGVTWEGLPMVTLGVKGLLYVELTCETINRDAHSSYGTVLPNAAWRLVWALSTIKSPD